MKKYTLLFVLCLIAFASCKKRTAEKEKPELVFAGLSHDKVHSGDPKDTLIINLRYTIAAAAVGTQETAPVIFFKDKRDQTITPMPFSDEVASKLPDGELNISGNITLKLNVGNFLVLRPDRPNGDTTQYEIYLKDRKKGIESNHVTTSDIYILP